MIKNTPDFAQLMARFRLQRGLSLGQLAQATRLSRTYIYHLESGQRRNPSPAIVENMVRALELQGEERRLLYTAFTRLTGQPVGDNWDEKLRQHQEHLAQLLVSSTTYPAQSLDRLWYIHSWNEAAITLFEAREEIAQQERVHLLDLVFGPHGQKRFPGWTDLSRRLANDFCYHTRTVAHLPVYKALWKHLREFPEFRRIAAYVHSEEKPEPSFVLRLQHSQVGLLSLRTATTIFTGGSSYSMVSYVPDDLSTLHVYQKCGWQPDS